MEKQRQRLQEMTSYEASLRAEGAKYIAGMDEVGRGPLAGPVYAACVVLPEDFDVLGVDDSKKLSAKKRTELDSVIRERAVAYGIGVADNREIDEVNILNATKRAMKRAFYNATEMLQRVNDNNITDNIEPPA
ncbi:MAG: ribonuclease HII, partial [Mogibacterium sp.]|nr:ribonuclease HII [Mogibacterium sp.]